MSIVFDHSQQLPTSEEDVNQLEISANNPVIL